MNDSEVADLRRALRRIVSEPPPVAPLTGQVVTAAKRRRRRLAAVTGVAAVLTGVAILVPIMLFRPGSQTVIAGQPSAAPSQAPPTTIFTGPPGKESRGPDQPQVGVAYPYDLYVHCGIHFARFGGQWWRAAPEQPDPRPAMAYGGNPYTSGTMTLVSPTEARFERHSPDVTVIFHPSSTQPEPCD
jgi:hypothetical protein